MLQRCVLLGLTGPPGSGKGVVSNMLQELCRIRNIGFHYFSLSDEVRKEASVRKSPQIRTSLKQIADQMRATYGNQIWATLVSKKILQVIDVSSPSLTIIDGIRNPAEVNELRQTFGSQFLLLGITANVDTLKNNLQRRGRSDEPSEMLSNMEKTLDLIKQELGEGEPEHGHNILACLEMSDFPIISNDYSIQYLHARVESVFKVGLSHLFLQDP